MTAGDAAGPQRKREAEVIARIAKGDQRALAQLYEENVDGLYAFVFYRVGRSASMAEDVVQETFVHALERLDDYDAARGSSRAWLCTMSRNIIRRHLRHAPTSGELGRAWQAVDDSLAELFDALDGGPLSDEVIERQQTRDLVGMTVANLPDHYRHVLERKYVAGETLETIATGLDVSVDATKSQLARARRAFRDTFLTLSRELPREAFDE